MDLLGLEVLRLLMQVASDGVSRAWIVLRLCHACCVSSSQKPRASLHLLIGLLTSSSNVGALREGHIARHYDMSL